MKSYFFNKQNDKSWTRSGNQGKRQTKKPMLGFQNFGFDSPYEVDDLDSPFHYNWWLVVSDSFDFLSEPFFQFFVSMWKFLSKVEFSSFVSLQKIRIRILSSETEINFRIKEKINWFHEIFLKWKSGVKRFFNHPERTF